MQRDVLETEIVHGMTVQLVVDVTIVYGTVAVPTTCVVVLEVTVTAVFISQPFFSKKVGSLTSLIGVISALHTGGHNDGRVHRPGYGAISWRLESRAQDGCSLV